MIEPIGILLRFLLKLRCRMVGVATIKDVPTERFNQLIQELRADGWRSTYQYEDFDAWIDYGCVKLQEGVTTLKFEWDNWTEGSVEGPRRVIEELGRKHALTVS